MSGPNGRCSVFYFAVALLMLVGCNEQAKTPTAPPKEKEVLSKPVDEGLGQIRDTPSQDPAPKDADVLGDDYNRNTSGIWIPYDPSKSWRMPEEVSIACVRSEQVCHVYTVRLFQVENENSGRVSVGAPDATDYAVQSWDARALSATVRNDYSGINGNCFTSLLTMNFKSKTVVTLTDIPTHEKGCEDFVGANSYRLAQGSYYVDVKSGQRIKSD
jgi:hypothetical protein